MKQFKLTVLSALILTAASTAHAADQTTGGFDGFASASVGHGSNDPSSGIDNSGLATDAQLALAYTDKSGFGGQLDLGYFRQNYDDSNVDLSFREAATHLYYRNQGWLAGIFAQQRKYYTNGDSNNVKANFLGLEGQVYLDNMTLYGQLGQGKWKYSSGTTDPAVMATLELRYFMRENLRLDASINYLKEDAGTLFKYVWNQKTYGVGAEYRFSGIPLSVLGRYEYADENQNTGSSANNQRLLIGVKLNFGKDSLRKSDREGASLKPISKDLIWGAI
ncbi:MAG: hypothetical protein Q8K52_07535 [Thiobacillus sp.]|nr:hypothetical protein [Thiobacillus sp.]